MIGDTTADRNPHTVPYDDVALAESVGRVAEESFDLADDSELSLAGLQNKLLLVETPDGWARPAEGYASTHTLKVEDRRFDGLAAAEAACLSLGRAVGVTTVHAEATTIGGIPVVIVERFDRALGEGGEVRRIHQEDACQALGVDPERMHVDAGGRPRRMGKYQVGGGPSFADIAQLLDRFAADAVEEHCRLLALATFTVAIGNGDAHGKNVGLLHPTPDRIELAPAYDTVPTALWPTLADRAAMFVNGRSLLSEVTGEDLVIEGAVKWGILRIDEAEEIVGTALDALEAAVTDPARDLGKHPVIERLRGYVRSRVDQLRSSMWGGLSHRP
ncbi:HipA domain-containing protein [Euzebya sp.]|uniref:HipA domain-containing protein n=1 Tax=Euzebya sp. TaxID=1971409 RepID=UPI00351218E6